MKYTKRYDARFQAIFNLELNFDAYPYKNILYKYPIMYCYINKNI